MLIVAAEVWDTKQGKIVKAVVRNEKGQIQSATNQTKPVPVPTIKGR